MTVYAGTYYIGDLCYVIHDVRDGFCNPMTECPSVKGVIGE